MYVINWDNFCILPFGASLILVALDISSLVCEVQKISRVQEYIAEEVIIQHHIRMDPCWSDSSVHQ